MKARTLAAAGLAAAGAIALGTTGWILATGGASADVLDLHVGLTDPDRPLAVATLCVLLALAVGWRSRVLRVAATALGLCAIGLAFTAIAADAPEMTPGGDIAVIESYTIHTIDGEMQLGPYSRYPWHHPGPLSFQLFAPFYLLSGRNTSGLAAAAATINVLSLAVVAWMLVRGGTGRFAAATLAVVAVYCYRASPLLASAWNPHVVVLPALALINVSARVAAGSPSLLVLGAFIASFVAQTHVGLLPVAMAMPACAVGAAAVAAGRRVEDRRRLLRAINVAAWVTLLLWWLPLVEQTTGRPGNLTRLGQFFAANDGQSFGVSVAVWGDMLAGLLDPGFSVAMGRPYRPGSGWWQPLVGVVQVVAVCWAARQAWRRGDRFAAYYCAFLAVASLVAFWSVLRIAGEISDHQVFWISALGALLLAAVADAGLTAAMRRPPTVAAPVAATACVLFVALAASFAAGELRTLSASAARPGDEDVAVKALADGIRGYLIAGGHGKPRLRIDQSAWQVAAGVVVQLQKAGVPFAVGREAIGMFHTTLAETGEETLDITISGTRTHERLVQTRPGLITIAGRRGVFADH